MNSAVFLSLNDMGKQLPESEEIPVAFPMAGDVEEEYERIEDTFIRVMKYQKHIA